MQTGSDLGYGATRENLRCNSDPNILTRKSPCEPNPGARPYPAGVADEAGPRRDDDARLQTSRHHHAVCSPQHPRWHRHWPQHAASSPPGVHPLPQRDRGAGPRGESDPCHRRQLCDPQAPKGAPMAGAASPLDGSTSPRPQHPGSTRSKASSPSSPASVSSAACSDLSVDLQFAVNCFVADTNADPKPFVWTADPKRVLAAVKRGKQTLKSVH